MAFSPTGTWLYYCNYFKPCYCFCFPARSERTVSVTLTISVAQCHLTEPRCSKQKNSFHFSDRNLTNSAPAKSEHIEILQILCLFLVQVLQSDWAICTLRRFFRQHSLTLHTDKINCPHQDTIRIFSLRNTGTLTCSFLCVWLTAVKSQGLVYLIQEFLWGHFHQCINKWPIFRHWLPLPFVSQVP